MDKITQKITEELKNKVIEKLQPQIKARDVGEQKVGRLEKSLAGFDEMAGKLKEKIRVLNKKATEDLGEGKSITKKRSDIKTLREDMNEAEDLGREIADTALPDARGLLKVAQTDFKIAVVAAVAEARKKYEGQMSSYIDNFMNVYNGWVAATRALYEEIRPGVLAGTIHEVPQVRNESFRRYVMNVGLGISETDRPVTGAKKEIEAKVAKEETEPAPGIEVEETEPDREAEQLN